MKSQSYTEEESPADAKLLLADDNSALPRARSFPVRKGTKPMLTSAGGAPPSSPPHKPIVENEHDDDDDTAPESTQDDSMTTTTNSQGGGGSPLRPSTPTSIEVRNYDTDYSGYRADLDISGLDQSIDSVDHQVVVQGDTIASAPNEEEQAVATKLVTVTQETLSQPAAEENEKQNETLVKDVTREANNETKEESLVAAQASSSSKVKSLVEALEKKSSNDDSEEDGSAENSSKIRQAKRSTTSAVAAAAAALEEKLFPKPIKESSGDEGAEPDEKTESDEKETIEGQGVTKRRADILEWRVTKEFQESFDRQEEHAAKDAEAESPSKEQQPSSKFLEAQALVASKLAKEVADVKLDALKEIRSRSDSAVISSQATSPGETALPPANFSDARARSSPGAIFTAVEVSLEENNLCGFQDTDEELQANIKSSGDDLVVSDSMQLVESTKIEVTDPHSPFCASALGDVTADIFKQVNSRMHDACQDICLEPSIERTVSMDKIEKARELEDKDGSFASSADEASQTASDVPITAESTESPDDDEVIPPPSLKSNNRGRGMSTIESVNSETGSIHMLAEDDTAMDPSVMGRLETPTKGNLSPKNTHETGENEPTLEKDLSTIEWTGFSEAQKVAGSQALDKTQTLPVSKASGTPLVRRFSLDKLRRSPSSTSVASDHSSTTKQSAASRRSKSSRKSTISNAALEEATADEAKETAEQTGSVFPEEDSVQYEPLTSDIADDISVEVSVRRESDALSVTEKQEDDAASTKDDSFLQLKFGSSKESEVEVVQKRAYTGPVDCDISVFSDSTGVTSTRGPSPPTIAQKQNATALGALTEEKEDTEMGAESVKPATTPSSTPASTPDRKARKPRRIAKGLKNFFSKKRGGKPPLPKSKGTALDGPKDTTKAGSEEHVSPVVVIEGMPEIVDVVEPSETIVLSEHRAVSLKSVKSSNVAEMLKDTASVQLTEVPMEAFAAKPLVSTSSDKSHAKLVDIINSGDVDDEAANLIRSSVQMERALEMSVDATEHTVEATLPKDALEAVEQPSKPEEETEQCDTEAADDLEYPSNAEQSTDRRKPSHGQLSRLFSRRGRDSKQQKGERSGSTRRSRSLDPKRNAPASVVESLEADKPALSSSRRWLRKKSTKQNDKATEIVDKADAETTVQPKADKDTASTKVSELAIGAAATAAAGAVVAEAASSAVERDIPNVSLDATPADVETEGKEASDGDDDSETDPENDLAQLVRSFSTDASQTAKQMVDEFQYAIQREFAKESVAKVEKSIVQSRSVDPNCSGVEDVPQVAALVGGLTRDVAKENSLFDMFTQGLLCCSVPTEDV